MMSLKVGKLTREEVLETVRKPLVRAACYGERLCIMIGRQSPDFKTFFTDDKILPTHKVFDFNAWRAEDNYKSILQENEDTD